MSNNEFEREAGLGMQESVVRVRNNRPGKLPALLLISAAVLALGAAYYVSFIKQPAQRKQPEETFNTARNQPGLLFDTPSQKTDNRLVLQPPPPPPPPALAPVVVAPTPVEAPPPPPVVDQDALRRQKEEEEARLKRLNSDQIIVSGGNGTGSAASVGPSAGVDSAGGGAGGDQYREDDPNRRFVNAISSRSVQIVTAARNTRTDALIPAGMFIHGVLETAIQSDLPGMVRAIMSDDVWSFDGRRVLLPKGTMLIGTYKSGLARGQTRVLIVWTRALGSDGTSVDLGSYGTDDLGRSGLTGEVDNHYLQRFGSAAVLSLVGGVSSFIAGLNIHGQSQSGSGSGSGNDISQQGASQAQQSISQTMSDMANTALKDEISIPPTLNVDQGTRIIIFVQRDLDFSALYPDPVKEALYELRHPKASRAGQPGNVGGAGNVPAARCCTNQGMVTKP